MQKLTDQVVTQLNDLPGFPARPNTVPPAPDRWVLGDWLVECRVNPEVADFASLPLVGNRVGDVRVSLADQGWYLWDGAAWQPMAGGGGGVNSVPATAQEILLAGELVRFVNAAGSPRAQKADATNADNRLNPVGFAVAGAAAGAPVSVRIAGVADVPAALFDAAPAPANVGQRVWMSTTEGQITLTAPTATGSIVQRVGVLVDGSASPRVLVQIGDPVLL